MSSYAFFTTVIMSAIADRSPVAALQRALLVAFRRYSWGMPSIIDLLPTRTVLGSACWSDSISSAFGRQRSATALHRSARPIATSSRMQVCMGPETAGFPVASPCRRHRGTRQRVPTCAPRLPAHHVVSPSARSSGLSGCVAENTIDAAFFLVEEFVAPCEDVEPSVARRRIGALFPHPGERRIGSPRTRESMSNAGR